MTGIFLHMAMASDFSAARQLSQREQSVLHSFYASGRWQHEYYLNTTVIIAPPYHWDTQTRSYHLVPTLRIVSESSNSESIGTSAPPTPNSELP
jgi:hypothetical protein